ncbi:MAG TPA: N-acetylmuramoyl-L-alanine amidase [Gallionella sp.]|nr:N-acetylmuramoyl-L-alanine amidase [Gallionella sp.]
MFKAILKLVTLSFFLWLPPGQAAPITVSAARIWPAQDYTRLTLESKHAIRYNMFNLNNPERLVIDLDNVGLGNTLNNLPKLVSNDDPYIKSLRVGRFKPGVVRLVLDLKGQVKPQLFVLKPVADYGYRLVLDVYPEQPVDPLMALIDSIPGTSNTPTSSPNVEKKPGNDKPEMTQALENSKVDNPATNTLLPPPTPPEMHARTLIIMIDPGHGGEDPGAHGKYGSLEKNVTLSIARKVKTLIDKQPNMRALLTRDGDYFIPLMGRVAKARKAHADLFVSIHADAFINSKARGSSVFALSEHGATSSAARWLAKSENEADLIGGVNIAVKDPYLARTLLDLSQTATINDSMKLAKDVLSQLGDINYLHTGHVEQAGFAVLKSPDIPSILVETAFISNPREERRLDDKNYQMKTARAIVDGINRYFSKNPALSKPRIAQIAN